MPAQLPSFGSFSLLPRIHHLDTFISQVTFFHCCTSHLRSTSFCAHASVLISLKALNALLPYQEQEDIKPPPGCACSQSADPGRLEGVVERCGGDVNRGGTHEEEGDTQPLRGR